jgi:hypothetical protein
MSRTETVQLAEITMLERRETAKVDSLVFPGHGVPGRSGWDARVEVGGALLHISRLDSDEQGRWVVDALIPAGTSMPAFMNGWGSRCTILRLAPADVAAMLDAATEGK